MRLQERKQRRVRLAGSVSWYLLGVEILLNIPDELAMQMQTDDAGLARTALEAFALEGYRSDRLSEADVRQLLGLETRMDVHAFLKEHGAYLHYSEADLERDRESALRMSDVRKSAARLKDRIAG
jgi:hypothetical protein